MKRRQISIALPVGRARKKLNIVGSPNYRHDLYRIWASASVGKKGANSSSVEHYLRDFQVNFIACFLEEGVVKTFDLVKYINKSTEIRCTSHFSETSFFIREERGCSKPPSRDIKKMHQNYPLDQSLKGRWSCL